MPSRNLDTSARRPSPSNSTEHGSSKQSYGRARHNPIEILLKASLVLNNSPARCAPEPLPIKPTREHTRLRRRKSAGTLWWGRRLVKDPQEATMQEHIYKVVELVGSSETSIEDAISTAISRANETIRQLRWFEVLQTRGHIEDGKVRHYQVALTVGFTMEAAG